MVLDAIEQSIWTRQQEGVLDLKDVVHHTDRGSQYTSIRFSERLAQAGIQPSVGAVGSSYDNALAETINGLYKTELIKPRKPWRTIEDVEVATGEWVHWFNHRRLYEYCGDIPPVDPERHHRRCWRRNRLGAEIAFADPCHRRYSAAAEEMGAPAPKSCGKWSSALSTG